MTAIAARPPRGTWLPVALVVIALLYAALVPTLLRREPDRLHSEIAGIVEPARRLARTRQTSLAVEVSAYRAYVISGDPQLLSHVREARTRTEALGAQLATLTARLDPQTVEAGAAVDHRIREWHTAPTPRAAVDLPSYRPTLPALQDRFEATEAAAERLDVALSHEAAQRARKADSLTVYHDLGNVALSLLGAASVLAVTRLARRAQRARGVAEAAVRSRDRVLSGSGIAPENVPYLFDRFWQATRTDRRGIGLGLSIVKALVEAHGGHVDVETRLGDGTTFFFSIPVAAALPSEEPGDRGPTARRGEAEWRPAS